MLPAAEGLRAVRCGRSWRHGPVSASLRAPPPGPGSLCRGAGAAARHRGHSTGPAPRRGRRGSRRGAHGGADRGGPGAGAAGGPAPLPRGVFGRIAGPVPAAGACHLADRGLRTAGRRGDVPAPAGRGARAQPRARRRLAGPRRLSRPPAPGRSARPVRSRACPACSTTRTGRSPTGAPMPWTPAAAPFRPSGTSRPSCPCD